MFHKLVPFFFRLMLRRKTSVISIVFLGLLILFLFTIGFSQRVQATLFFPSIFLICIFFMGQFLLMETHQRFEQEKTLQALILTGQSPSNVFFALLICFTILMLGISFVLWILMHLFFQSPLIINPSIFFAVLSTLVSYTSLGLLMYGFHAFSKIHYTFIVVLFFPLLVPLFLYAHQAFFQLLQQGSTGIWPHLIGINLLFVFSSSLLYERIAEELL